MDSIRALINRFLKRTTTFREQTVSEDMKQFTEQVQRALDNGEFEVYYQPQYNYTTNKMSGAEALMRWSCPKRGLLSPASFIPQLERSGMIYEVDKYIWRSVCADIRKWEDEGINFPHFSINISGVDIYRADFEQYLSQIIASHGLTSEMLHLEITETIYAKDIKFMSGIIQDLQKRGFTVEMDDFGSGYSSLKTLKNVPFDIIKLDVEFLQESETNEKAKEILTAIIGMLHKIKISVIVEGVESKKSRQS